jgi:sodium/potassium/calcium exchanger 6
LPHAQYCEASGLFNYYTLSYCTLGKMMWLAYVIIIAWMLVLFYMLGNTAEEHCEPLCFVLRSSFFVLRAWH